MSKDREKFDFTCHELFNTSPRHRRLTAEYDIIQKIQKISEEVDKTT